MFQLKLGKPRSVTHAKAQQVVFPVWGCDISWGKYRFPRVTTKCQDVWEAKVGTLVLDRLRDQF